MKVTLSALALFTGLLAGAVFAFVRVPIPAPPELPGIMGIIGIYLGYKLVRRLDVGYDLLSVLGL